LLAECTLHRCGHTVGFESGAEGGAHQSIAQPLIGLSQDGLTAFEPAFVDELSVILRWALDYIQKDDDGDGDHLEHNGLTDEAGGAVYLRLSTRPIEQLKREMTAALCQSIVDGGYWLRPPGPNCEVVIAYAGTVAREAIRAIGLMAEDRRDVGLLSVTSADRLMAGWSAANRARERGHGHARSHVERLLEAVPATCSLVTVIDAHPLTLGWLGSVRGHRVRQLGAENFGQTGTIADLYRHYGIDSAAIIAAVEAMTPGRPIRYMNLVGALIGVP
jgi:pyruvate dehydrogenase E1 component